MRISYVRFGLVVAVSALAACSAPAAPKGEVVGISGTVVDSSDRPTTGTVVDFYPAEATARQTAALRPQSAPVYRTTTDAAGAYRYPDAPAGAYNVIVTRQSEVAMAAGVEARNGLVLEIPPLRLTLPGAVSGLATLADSPGDSEGIDVFIPGTPYSARTDAAGRYTIPLVPAGTRRVVAQAPAYAKVAAEVEVKSLATATVPALRLARAGPVIASIDPPVAVRGQTVTISGSRFGTSRGTSNVRFGDVEAAITDYVSWSPTEVKVKVPATAIPGPITLSVGDQEAVSTTLKVVPPPVIVSFESPPVLFGAASTISWSTLYADTVELTGPYPTTPTGPTSATVTLPVQSPYLGFEFTLTATNLAGTVTAKTGVQAGPVVVNISPSSEILYTPRERSVTLTATVSGAVNSNIANWQVRRGDTVLNPAPEEFKVTGNTAVFTATGTLGGSGEYAIEAFPEASPDDFRNLGPSYITVCVPSPERPDRPNCF